MDAPSSNVRENLQKLRIDKSQRPSGATVSASQPRPVRASAPPAAQRRGGLGKYVWLVILLGLGGAGYAYRDRFMGTLQGALATPPEVRLVSVTVQQGSSTPAVHTATGKIVSDHRVRVATKVSGQITKLMFEQGDRVKEGQVIATIEDVNYVARRDNAKAKFEEQKAKLAFAKVNFERIDRLYKINNAPELEFVQAKSEYEAAQATMAADQAALTEAQWRVDWCQVTAPITGVVLDRNVEVGDFVAAEGGFGGMANSQFATIADMTMLRVEVDVSELDITKIFKDMPCLVIPDAYKDRRYTGHVMWIDPGANFSKGTVQVKVRIDNPDEYLRVEGSARVDFKKEAEVENADAAKATLWLAKSAVLVDSAAGAGGTSGPETSDSGANGRGTASSAPTAEGSGAAASVAGTTGVVMRFGNERLARTTVRIGRATERQYEILSGLSAGDRVADEPANFKDGQRVKAPGT